MRVYGKTRSQRRSGGRCSRRAPGDAAEEERLAPTVRSATPRNCQFSERPTRPELDVAEAERQRQQQPEHQQHEPGLEEEEVGAVDEHRAQVDPRRLPGREPARALVVAQPALAVLEEASPAPRRCAAPCAPTSAPSRTRTPTTGSAGPCAASASRVMPRMPQWMSEKRLPKTRFRIQVVTGVPR